MVFQPDSIRSLFFCLEDPTQIANCCSFLNCSPTSAGGKNGPTKTSSNSSKSIVNFNKKVTHKKKFKSKKKIVKKKSSKTSKETLKPSSLTSGSSTTSSGPKKRKVLSKASSALKSSSKRSSLPKNPYDKITENLSNSLRSFQFQTHQLTLKYLPESFDRDDETIITEFENILQELYFDINKTNLWMAKNCGKKTTTKASKAVKEEQSENTKPGSSKGSKVKGQQPPAILNGREKFLADSYLVIRLLHVECNLLKYLQVLETLFGVDVSSLFSSERFSKAQRSLLNLAKVYYSLLTKLNISKATMQIHTSSKRNSCALFYIFSRIQFHYRMPAKEDSEFLEVETDGKGVPDIRLKKVPAGRAGSSCDPKLMFTQLMIHLEQMIKKDLYASCFETGESLKQVKMNMVGLCRQNTLEFAMSSSLVSILRDVLGTFKNFWNVKAKNKSTFRQKVIELLAFVCIKRNGALDAIALGSSFIQDLISLLSLMAVSHAKVVFRDLTKLMLTYEPDTPLRAVSKNYLSILKDIYGLLSIFLSFTEFKEGIECLQFHNVAENLYGSFLEPFVEMLNGLEDCDPKHLKIADSLNFKDNPSLAYETFKIALKEHSKMNRYLDRIVGISSLIIQRLLPALLIPIEGLSNPFTFQLPEVEGEPSQPHRRESARLKKAKEQNDYMVMDEEIEEDDGDYSDYNDNEDENTPSSSTAAFPVPDSWNSQANNPLLSSYLQYFPEIDLNARGISKLSIACGCSSNTCFRDNPPDVKPNYCLCPNYCSAQPKPEFLSPEKWKQSFDFFYAQTKSVMPKSEREVPFPDANFIYASDSRNQPLAPMSYPFLDQLPQRKNFHYIKSVEMIQQRLGPKPITQKIYDNSGEVPGSSKDENYLKFDSAFECGNLRSAMVVVEPTKPDEEEYILMLSSDVNTTIHTQWFYFSVSGTRTDKRYRFKIINLQKKSILYNSGQQPAFYSVGDYRESSKMWQRLGKDNSVSYYRNHYVRTESSKMTDKFFTLEFCVNFQHEGDVCYFAYNVPYSYSFLRTNILQWKLLVDQQNSNQDGREENDEYSKTFFFVQSLCSTLKGNDLPVLTITSKANVQASNRKPHYVFVTARVHPSESNSSWVMKGFIDSLIVKQRDVDLELRRRRILERYVFKIVPMLNPDGVINGSTRTGLQKVDLNRQWLNPNPLLYPTIYHTKMLMKCLNYHSGALNPVAYIDLHGHSRQKNIFSYSCSPYSSWKLADRNQARNRTSACSCGHTSGQCQLKQMIAHIEREPSLDDQAFYFIPPYIMLPFLMYDQKAPCFSINDCSFNIQKDRESSGRIVAWRQFDIPLSYTIECSASGMDFGPFSGYHLDISHLEGMGENLAKAFSSLHFLKCANKHIPVVVLPKDEPEVVAMGQESTSGTPLTRQQLVSKLHKKATSTKYSKNDPISVKLIDLYSDLNTEVYPLGGTGSTSSSATPTPSSSKNPTPARRTKSLRKKSRDTK